MLFFGFSFYKDNYNFIQSEIEQNNKTVFTDENGHFAIGLQKGNFSINISKNGYQTLSLTNYVSDPDQVSNTTIILEKGEDTVKFEIPKRTK